MQSIKPFLLIIILTFSWNHQAWSQNPTKEYQVETLAEGLGIPWGMAFIAPDQLLFTLREGRGGILNTHTRQTQWLSGLPPVHARGQGGLLDVALAPDFAQTGWLYFTYSKPGNAQQSGAVTALARAKLQGSALINWQDLLITQSAESSNIHFGSRIAFDDKGYVYFTVGDRGQRENGQITDNHAGTVIRLHLDGQVPKDNPFVGKVGFLPEIWSYGHRNPQGLVFDSQHKRLWLIEHGPRGGDEINLIQAGQNYGWPEVSQGQEYWGPFAIGVTQKDGMVDPVKVYIPSIAPSSLLLYQGQAFAQWQGNLFAGALVLQHLNRVVLNQQGEPIDEQRLLSELNERIRALAEDHQGWIYFSTDSGKIMRLKPH